MSAGRSPAPFARGFGRGKRDKSCLLPVLLKILFLRLEHVHKQVDVLLVNQGASVRCPQGHQQSAPQCTWKFLVLCWRHRMQVQRIHPQEYALHSGSQIELQVDSERRSIQELTVIVDSQRMDHTITGCEQSRRDQVLLREELSEQNRDLREAL